MNGAIDEIEEHRAGLFLRRLVPQEPILRRMLWIHGASEHGERHLEAARRFARRGVEVWLPDLPGHGRDRVPHHLATPREMRQSLIALLDTGPSREPVDLFGHSMGALLAIGLAREAPERFRRAALSAPFLAPARPVPAWKQISGRVAAKYFPSLRFSLGVDSRDLHRNPLEQLRAREDPLRRRGIGARAGVALLAEAARRNSEVDPFPLPCLVLLAGEDRVVSTSRARAWAERCQTTWVEFPLLRHEILREPERAIVGMALQRWFDQD